MSNIQFNEQSSESRVFLDNLETIYQNKMNYFSLPKDTPTKTEKLENF